MGWEQFLRTYLGNATLLITAAGKAWDDAQAAANKGSYEPKKALSDFVKLSGLTLDLWFLPYSAPSSLVEPLIVIQAAADRVPEHGKGPSAETTLPRAPQATPECTDAVSPNGAARILAAKLKATPINANDLRVTMEDAGGAQLQQGLYLGYVTAGGSAVARLVIHLV
jgi:hypothetical protein